MEMRKKTVTGYVMEMHGWIVLTSAKECRERIATAYVTDQDQSGRIVSECVEGTHTGIVTEFVWAQTEYWIASEYVMEMQYGIVQECVTEMRGWIVQEPALVQHGQIVQEYAEETRDLIVQAYVEEIPQ